MAGNTIHFDLSPYNHYMLKKLKKELKLRTLNETIERVISSHEILNIALKRYPEIIDLMILANRRRGEEQIKELRKFNESGRKKTQ